MIHKYEIDLDKIRKFTHIIGNIIKNNAIKIEISENNGVWESTLLSSNTKNDVTLFITPFTIDCKINLEKINNDEIKTAKNTIQDYWFAFMYKNYGEKYENDYYNYWCGYNKCVCNEIQNEKKLEDPNQIYNKVNQMLEERLQKIKESNPILIEEEKE